MLYAHAQMTSVRIAREVAIDLVKNAVASVPGFRRIRMLRPRSASGPITAEYLRRHAFYMLDIVLSWADDVVGKDVAEAGVGDNLASGFAFLAAGARSYTAADPYVGDVRSDRARQVYKAAADLWTAERGRLREGLSPQDFPNDNVDVCRQPLEGIAGKDRFDLICSLSVVEHVWDFERFAAATRRLLRPDGVALHWIDLSPHGKWSEFADPMTFLAVPDSLWRTGRVRGLPTRLRLHEMVAIFEAADLRVEVLETNEFIGARDGAPIQLAKRFRSMSFDEVVIAGATLKISRTG
ncbi:MAG: hypothetical protein QOF21_1450 [Actinomycetota bacterium]|jgi:SAM-dependent methyltransferase